MKNSNRINHNKVLDIDVISNLLNYELRTNKIIRPLTENIHFKILIPCVAAGAIIGKGGEAIAIIQKESGAKVKISKSYDFYPGTTERICLIMGSIEAVTRVHDYIIDKIQEKPDQLARQVIDGKGVVERHKQVKILVPNSTAGMIIGKSGCYIKEIKDKSGSFIQISQKSKEINLSERCVTVAGEKEQNRLAVHLILDKISEDPHSASCPTISYVDIIGPVASAYPTGSPYAMIGNNFSLNSPNNLQNCSGGPNLNSLTSSSSPSPPSSTNNLLSVSYLTSQTALDSSSLNDTNGPLQPYGTNNYSTNLLSVITSNTNYLPSSDSPIQSDTTNTIPDFHHHHHHHHNHHSSSLYYDDEPLQQYTTPLDISTDMTALEFIRNILRISGFSDLSADSISRAIETLCQYGLITNSLLTSSGSTSTATTTTSTGSTTTTATIVGSNTTTATTNVNIINGSASSSNIPTKQPSLTSSTSASSLSSMASVTNNNLRFFNNSITLYQQFPLYGTPPTTSNNPNSSSINSNDDLLSSTCPLDFLIQSYLNHVAAKKEQLLSPVTSLNTLLTTYGGEIQSRNVEINSKKMELFGTLESELIKDIKLKTQTDIKIDHEKSRISDGIYSLKVTGKKLDNILDAIGKIIYSKVDNNNHISSNSIIQPSSKSSLINLNIYPQTAVY